MSRLPELSSTVPSLIGAPCANATGMPLLSASAPVEPKKLRRVTFMLSSFGLLAPSRGRAGWWRSDRSLRVGLLGRPSLHGPDRRRKIDADRIADALQGRQLQRHAHDAVENLVHRRFGAVARAVAASCRGAKPAYLVNADAVDLLHRFHHGGDDLRHLVEAMALELQAHQAVAARILGCDERLAAFGFGQHAQPFGIGAGARGLRF